MVIALATALGAVKVSSWEVERDPHPVWLESWNVRQLKSIWWRNLKISEIYWFGRALWIYEPTFRECATQLDATLWCWYFYSNAGKYDIQKSKWAILVSLDGDLQLMANIVHQLGCPKNPLKPSTILQTAYDVTSWLAGFQPSTYCTSKGLIILVLGRLPFLTDLFAPTGMLQRKQILDVRWSTLKMKKFVPRVLNKLSNLLSAGLCNPKTQAIRV